MPTSVDRNEVIAACKTYGPLLQVPPGFEGEAVMQAIASNESSLGVNCGPRQEPAYSSGGSLAKGPQALLNEQFGDAVAASSYGPWQMMFGNFTTEAMSDIFYGKMTLDDYAKEFVRFFNTYVIRDRKAQNLAQIGEVWNLGHVGADLEYVSKLEAAYQTATGVTA